MTTILLLCVLGPSYNQPKFASCATWNSNAITFADSTIVGTNPIDIYIDINNTIYIAAQSLNLVQIWLEGNMTPAKTLSVGLSNPFAAVASTTGNIYVDNGNVNDQVDMWSWNATSSVAVMNVTSRCISLFLDINNTLYCSNDQEHKVVKTSLSSGSTAAIIAAGTGVNGSQADMLYDPNGIFVDKNFNLYVADYGNNRIQLFQSGQRNATTVAGNGFSGSIQLHHPTGIVLDADEYLFISDTGNNRIIRSGPYGFQCLLGCSGGSGSAPNQLKLPHTLRFDSYGNIFVVDHGNNRTQKFLLMTNSCGKYLISSHRTDSLEKFSRKQRLLLSTQNLCT
jgi:sugar lactone lactonase YvrE